MCYASNVVGVAATAECELVHLLGSAFRKQRQAQCGYYRLWLQLLVPAGGSGPPTAVHVPR